MEVIPAIDIVRGKAVRLTGGNFYFQTVYTKTPAEFAEQWSSYAIALLHIVDLDGARAGAPKNTETIKKIIKRSKVSVEAGGGIRDEDSLRKLLDVGVHQVVIGTMALDEAFIRILTKRYLEKVVISVDAKDGIVRTKGWLNNSGLKAVDFLRMIEAAGFKRVNYTDIAMDGMLRGPNVTRIKEVLKATKVSIVAAGGISSLDDVKKLKELEEKGLIGVIVGKALYEEKLDLQKAIEVAAK